SRRRRHAVRAVGAVRRRCRLGARLRRALWTAAARRHGAGAARPGGDRAAVAARGGRVTGPRPATAAVAPEVIDLLARIWPEYGFIWDPEAEFPDLLRFRPPSA